MTAAAAGRLKRQWEKATESERVLATSPFFSRARRRVSESPYPEVEGVHIWQYRGTTCTIVRCDWYEQEVAKMKASPSARQLLAHSIKWLGAKIGNLQGYARFPKRPLYQRGFNGIVGYIPVPGGITYAQSYIDGSFVYGYDTAHINQEGLQFKDVSWHVVQVEFMVDAIIIARRLEKRYRRALTREAKIDIIGEFDRRLRHRGKQINLSDNTGLMLRLFGGDV